jgi:hypothetical protein
MKNFSKVLISAVFILSFIILLAASQVMTGCSIIGIVKESYMSKDDDLELPEVEIDEKEISEIGKEDINIKKSYAIEDEIDLIDESMKDPFKPFYIEEETEGTEEEKNIFELERIYITDGVEYAELSFNEHLYLLKENDLFGYYYFVQAINETSIVLLKGDDTLTVFLGSVLYD